MKKRYCFALAILVLIVDQLSKYWVNTHLIPYQPMPVSSMLNFSLAYNTGAAFSFLSGAGDWHRWFFAGFNILVSCILIVWLWRTAHQAKIQSIGLSLILAGAVGNVLDRFFYGHVIDFIDVHYQHHHFATFNLADSAICIGAALLILDLLVHRK